jgi:hypothetical protein
LATKTFAVVEAILGILVILVPWLWCYVIPSGGSIDILVCVETVLGVLVLIVAAVALATK